MHIPATALEWRETDLILDERTVKGVPDAIPAGNLGTRILLGDPVCRSMVDVARELAEQDPGHTYTLVELGATFSPSEGEQVQQAWLMANLSAVETSTANHSNIQPIAWSMTPDRLSTPLSQSLGVEVQADFQIFSVGMNRSRSADGQEIWLEALNIRRSDPVWEFTRTSTTRVYGSHTLNLMVRSAMGQKVQGQLSLLAKIRRKHLNVLPYRVLLGDSPDDAKFVLTAE